MKFKWNNLILQLYRYREVFTLVLSNNFNSTPKIDFDKTPYHTLDVEVKQRVLKALINGKRKPYDTHNTTISVLMNKSVDTYLKSPHMIEYAFNNGAFFDFPFFISKAKIVDVSKGILSVDGEYRAYMYPSASTTKDGVFYMEFSYDGKAWEILTADIKEKKQ